MVMTGWAKSKQPTVNCWFCNEDSCIELPKESSGWTCPSCHQYNGFNEDGDYDHVIPEQYEMSKNDKTYCHRENFVVGESALCRSCHQNQALKIGQLASFVPLSECHYDEEVEAYGEYLESVYRLCRCCKDKVQSYLARQDDHIFNKLDTESLQITKAGLHDNVSEDTLLTHAKGSFQSWVIRTFFSLCFLMAVTSTFISVEGCLELERRRMRSLLPAGVYTAIYYLKSAITCPCSTQLPVYFGTGCCLIGLLAVGKKCVYIVDALHILHWLALLILNVLSPSWSQSLHTSTICLILCLSTTCVSLMCLTMSRHSWKFSENTSQVINMSTSSRERNALRDENLPDANVKVASESEGFPPSSVSPSSPFSSSTVSPPFPQSPLFQSSPLSPSSSPLLYPVGEPKNFFKPISSQSATSSPTSLSSSSPTNLSNQEKCKSTYEVVRDGLESFSLGLAKKSGSTSSIWSLPSMLSLEPPSPDSTSPTNAGVMTTTKEDVAQSVARNILSPSRLSFLSLSHPPSPGKFSSSPNSDPDSGFSLDSSQHSNSQSFDIFTSKIDQSSQRSKGDKMSLKHPFPCQQKQSFTKYRSESKSFSLKSRTLSDQLQSSAKERNNVIVPDSTSNENAGPRLRRSDRIAMRGKIIKPWPLKKSLSVNNMYDRPHDGDILKKGNSVTNEMGMKIRTEAPHLLPSARNTADPAQKIRGFLDNIAELSDDEDLDSSSSHTMNQRRVMRGEKDKESKWIWTLFGLVIGISLTVNFFLGLNLWMNN